MYELLNNVNVRAVQINLTTPYDLQVAISLRGERGSVLLSKRSVMMNFVESIKVTTAFSDFDPLNSTSATDFADVFRIVSNSATVTPGMAFATCGSTTDVPKTVPTAIDATDLERNDLLSLSFIAERLEVVF